MSSTRSTASWLWRMAASKPTFWCDSTLRLLHMNLNRHGPLVCFPLLPMCGPGRSSSDWFLPLLPLPGGNAAACLATKFCTFVLQDSASSMGLGNGSGHTRFSRQISRKNSIASPALLEAPWDTCCEKQPYEIFGKFAESPLAEKFNEASLDPSISARKGMRWRNRRHRKSC